MGFRNSPDVTRERELTAVQQAGNRFGVTAVAFALLAGLCAVFLDLDPVAWAFGPTGLVLGGTGLVLWARGRASNRDDALIGICVAGLVLIVLLGKLALALPPMPTEPYLMVP